MLDYFSSVLTVSNIPSANTLFVILFALIFQFIASFSIITFPLQIISVISKWHIHVKFGESGWKSLIPFYNDYVFYKNIWGNARMLFLPLGCIFFLIVYSFVHDILWIFISFTLLISSICCYVVTHLKLARVFGKSAGFGVGLMIFPFVFLPILAFGKAKYSDKETPVLLKCNLKK